MWGSISRVRACIVVLLLGAVATAPHVAARSTTQLTIRYSFKNTPDGYFPCCGLIQASDGRFYGVTEGGGTSNSGTIFQMTLDGAVTVLHSFDRFAEGSPLGILQATDGNFYGATGTGGNGLGIIFRLTPGGTFFVLHTFSGPDGARPDAGLIQASDGNLYGTTEEGGSTFGENLTFNASQGYGTVFRLGLDGTFAVMYSFGTAQAPADTDVVGVVSDVDGAYPQSSVIQGSDGNLYGMTTEGGPSGAGTIFRLALSGTLTVLRAFDYTDGAFPVGEGLTQGSDGALYGMTSGTQGVDPGDPHGEIFRLTLDDTFDVLHSFNFSTDGGQPFSTLLQSADGSFYGTTNSGGQFGEGTVFRLAAGGTFTVIHTFDGADGANPLGGLTRGSDGNLYGTTGNGGSDGAGTIFELSSDEATLALGNLTATYNGTPQAVAVTSTPSGLSGVAVTYDGSPTPPAAAGTYAVVATLSNSDYVASAATGTLTILPAPLTVTADDSTMIVGSSLPAFSVTDATFVGGDGPASLGGTLAFSTTATSSSFPGTYPIVPAGLTSTNYALTFVPGTLTVSYGVAVLFDQTKSVKSGATLPIKLQVVDIHGTDLSSSSTSLTAVGLTQVSNGASDAVMDAGNANPDNNFRFDPTIGPTGGYIFNFKTTGLGTGTYALSFNVSGDPSVHKVLFQVR